MTYEFNGFIPVVHPSSFVHPQASVTGNVIIGKDVYIGPGAAIRGDWGAIVIKDGCNIQENCTLHMFPGTTMTLEENVHVGHGAIIHGANIGQNTLIGMNAVIMDNVRVEEECVIGALTFIKAKKRVPKRSLVVGNPARIISEVSDKMLKWKTMGTKLYQTLPKSCKDTLKACEPLSEIPKDRPNQEAMLKSWEQIKGNSGYKV